MKEIRELVGLVEVVRRRILINAWARHWSRWSIWVLVALLLAVLVSPLLTAPLALASAALLAAGALALRRGCRARGSLYDSARRLDAAAGLHDRISTALYLDNAEAPGPAVLRQRRDAVQRTAGLDVRALFPLRVPFEAKRAAVLCALVVALFAYRIHTGLPLAAMVARIPAVRLAKAALAEKLRELAAPRPQQTEIALQRSQELPLDDRKQDAGQDAQQSSAASQQSPAGQAQKSSQDVAARPREQQQPSAQQQTGAGTQQQSAGQQQKNAQQNDGQGNQQPSREMKEAEQGGAAQQQQQDGGRQQAQSRQQQDGASPQEQSGEGRQQPGEQRAQAGNQGPQPGSQQQQQQANQGSRGSQSLAQSVMQALKDLVANATGQKSAQAATRPSGNSQTGSPQSGRQQQAKSQSQGSSSSEPQPGQNSASGAKGPALASNGDAGGKQANDQPDSGIGNQPGDHQLRDNPELPVKTIADRVQLSAADVSDGPNIRARAGQGDAKLPVRGGTARHQAATGGAEQDTVPARYLQYVQRYFDHGAQARSSGSRSQRARPATPRDQE